MKKNINKPSKHRRKMTKKLAARENNVKHREMA